MKKLLPIILASIMLLCGCQAVDERDNQIDYQALTSENMKLIHGEPDIINNEHFTYLNAEIYGIKCKAEYRFKDNLFKSAYYRFDSLDNSMLVNLKNVLITKYGHNYTESDNYISWTNYNYELKIIINQENKMLSFDKINSLPTSSTTNAPETTLNKATLPKDYYETKSTTKSADSYEWTISTNSDGYDWNSVNDMEKDVWCSNSFAAWRLMGYDIPNDASQSELKRMIDAFYADEENCKVDITTVTESYAILKGIY